MRLTPFVAIAILAFATACSKPPATDPVATDAAKGAPAAATATSAPASDPGPAGQPMGKIGADQVGKVSPVPAFKGFGEHWSVNIQATGEMNHKVDLTWGSGSERANGSARYNGQPADAPAGLIVLSGELPTAQGIKPMTIEISRQACTDDGDNPHSYSVQVHVDGMDPLLGGCGDLAMY